MSSVSAMLDDPTAQARLESWPVLVRLWAEHPMGTGFFYLVPGMNMSIHSLYFMVLLSTGVIGFGGFVGFSVAVMIDGVRSSRLESPLARAIGAAGAGVVLLILLNGISGGLLTRPHLNLAVTGLLALVAAAWNIFGRLPSADEPAVLAATPGSESAGAR